MILTNSKDKQNQTSWIELSSLELWKLAATRLQKKSMLFEQN